MKIITGRNQRVDLATSLAVSLFLIFFVFLSIERQSPPAAVGASAPASEFSSGRARHHLEAIAKRPHPIGSPDHAEVREYLLQELKAIGLNPEVQTATVLSPRRTSLVVGGTVHNVMARLEGTENTKAILIAAHYDSVPTGPGASDDGAAVAVMLETGRILKSSSPLKNDVIFLFTDGEEAGLLGAKAFVDEHPWMKDVGLVLNLEARGNSGPSMMFETSSQNGWLIEEFAKSDSRPVTNSLLYEVYRLLPNDTDFSVFKEAGSSGFNFAYINGVDHYHTLNDSVEAMSEDSLQHHGQSTLSLARHFGNLNLTNTRRTDAIYFDLFSSTLIHYSRSWAIPLAAFVTLLFTGALAVGLRRKALTIRGLAFGFFAFLLNITAIPVIAILIWSLITLTREGYRSMPMGGAYNDEAYMVGFAAMSIAAASLLQIWFQRKTSAQNLAAGSLIWWVILMIVTSLFLPGGSYLFTLPLLFSSIGLGFIFASKHLSPATFKQVAVISICAMPGLVLLAPVIYMMFVALTLNNSAFVVGVIVLLLGLLIMHLSIISAPGKWLLPGISGLVFLAFMVVGSLTSGFGKSQPKPNNVLYALDANTGAAIWASVDEKTDEWTSQFFPSSSERGVLTEYLPSYRASFLKTDAPQVTLPAPSIVTVGDAVADGIRALRLRIKSTRRAASISVYVESGTEILGAVINGKPVDRLTATARGEAGHRWEFSYYAPPEDGVELILQTKSTGPIKVRAVDQSYGLPEIPGTVITARPHYMIPAALPYSDSTLVSKSFAF